MLNKKFAKTIIQLYSDSGKQWLDNLPTLLSNLEKHWHFKVIESFSCLTYHLVLKVSLLDGNTAVLKCGVPNPELYTQIAALKHFNGQGVVKLLKADESLGVMLLENILPGIPLTKLRNDDAATEIFAEVMSKLHQPIQNESSFPTVQQWFEGFDRLYQQFDGKAGPLPFALVDCAYQIGVELINSMGERVLLHGDLHHTNILSATRESWLAIDPKGVVGEREYEVGAFIRNPMPTLITNMDTKKILTRRIDLLAELTGFDRKRLLGWSFYQAVLAAIWCFEDMGKGFEPFIRCAEVLKVIADEKNLIL